MIAAITKTPAEGQGQPVGSSRIIDGHLRQYHKNTRREVPADAVTDKFIYGFLARGRREANLR